MTKPQRLLLPREDGIACPKGGFARLLEFARLAALLQGGLELVGRIEMILQRTLVAAGDENELLDAGCQAFLDRILDERPVDDREHLLRHGLGGGQKAGTQTGNR